MSEARDIFAANSRSFGPNEDSFRRLTEAARLWRQAGQPFSAAVAMSMAAYAAWGRPERMAEAHASAILDLRQAIADSPPSSPASIAALSRLHRELRTSIWMTGADAKGTESVIHELLEELGQRLLDNFSDSEHADNFLVRGVRVSTDLDGLWTLEYPDYEVSVDTESIGAVLTFGVPSAFQLFVWQEDWHGAHEIVKSRSAAFASWGLRGWRAVVLANVDHANAAERFAQAADAFAQDTLPSESELAARGGHWWGINSQLWAKYFKARSLIEEAKKKPANVNHFVHAAVDALQGTESGWHSGQAARFRILVNVLAKLLSDPTNLNAEEARKQYMFEVSLTDRDLGQIDPSEIVALRFIDEAARGVRGYESDPATELTRNSLSNALDALGRLPMMGTDLAEALRPAIGRTTLQLVLGPVRTWMHRVLQRIADEAQLRRIFLRLLQGGLPLYAQVRHGPVEFGKDLVALVEVDDEVVLQLYQLKVGDIDKKKWRESKDEIEEMFLIPTASMQLPKVPTKVVGFLVCNGHANPYAEPVMDAWIKEQRTRGREIEFFHLDRLINWIIEHRLINELKLVLVDEGIPVSGNGL